MGLRDDDAQAYENDALLQWARQYPKDRYDSYDHPHSQDEQDYLNDARKQWENRRPRTSDDELKSGRDC